MANVNDVHDMAGQVARNREKLAAADIDDRDQTAIEEFADYREFVEERAGSTVRDDIGNLRRCAERAPNPLVEFESRKDANRLLKINATEYGVSDSSNDNYRKVMRVFFKWLNEDESRAEYPFWEDITIPTRDADPVDPDELLSPSEVRAFRDAADHPREKALIEFLADTGMRAAAALQVKRGDLHGLDDETPTFKPNKDGEAQKGLPVKALPIIHSQHHLRTYLNNYHPDDHPEAAVFAVKDYEHRERSDGAMHPTTASNKLKDIAETAGFDRHRVHPHAFRHVATTRMRRDLDMEWDDIAHRTGWSRRSLNRMKDIYSHLTNEEKNERIFRAAGREVSDAESQGEAFIDCRNCNREIQADEHYCPGCGVAVSPDIGAIEDAADDAREEAADRGLDSDDPEERAAMKAIREAVDDPVALAEELAALED